MALAPNISLTTLFGPSVLVTDDSISFKLNELSLTGDTSKLSGEGIILALLQHLEKIQGVDTNRVMEVRSNPIFTTKGNEPTIGQAVNVRIFSTVPIAELSPNQV